MDYTRQHTDETWRKTAAAALSTSAAWQDYATYCLEQERGLRGKAFEALERFIVFIAGRPFAERRSFVSWLMGRADGFYDQRLLIPFPLKVRVVEPTLLEWTQAEPACSEPHRWLGGQDDLWKAMELDPSDHVARKRLVLSILAGIDYATHELPYGYLGSVPEDLEALRQAEALLPGLPNPEDRTAYAAILEEERAAILEYLRRTS